MSILNRHPVRRTAAGVLAGALALSGAVAAATPASAAAGFTLERIAGADRYETSALTAARFDQAAAVTNVIVASGENGRAADALGASFLAGVRGAPVLLTPQAGLAASTRSALTSLRANGATTVTIVGGPAAVSANVMTQIMALGFTVDRLGGVDRFQTAELVVAAGEVAAAGNTGVASNVGIVASGISTVDALAVGPLAYKGRHPIFLTRAAGISASTIASMRANGVTSVYIVGGEAVVSAAVRTQLTAAGITVVDRLAGQTRSGTSVAIANAIIGGTFGFTNTTFNVASGANDGVDALSGAALSGQQNRALLITDTATNAGAVLDFARARAATLNAPGIVFGGPAALAVAVEEAIETAGGGGPTASNQTFTATTGAASSFVAGGGVTQFSFNVGNATRVDIQLLPCGNVTTPASGPTTFTGTNPGGTGNFAVTPTTAVASDITVVNGVAGASTDQVTPVNGVVTFTVVADAADACVVPVVFADPNDVDRIALNANGQPTNAFGVGGQITVRAAEATAGAVSASDVTRVDLTNNFFQTAAGSFLYQPARDVFRLQGTGGTTTVLTAAEFEARLSVGDRISGIYNPTVGSSFTLDDVAPGAPAGVATQTATGTNVGRAGIQVTFNDATATTVASYNVFRANAVQPTVIGQGVTCPDPATTAGAAAYTSVGTVANVANQTSYVFFDATATPPTAGQTPVPQFCYAVQSVDETGDVGPLSVATAPTTATAASATTGLSFVSAGSTVVNATTVRVRYNAAVNPATVAANGSDFRVASTTGGVATNVAVASAVRDPATDTDVVLTLSGTGITGSLATGTITVTAQAGTDANTVCGVLSATNCQAAGQAVQVAAAAPSDVVAPGLATAVPNADRTAVVLTYGEAVVAAGPNPNAFDSTQFTYRPDCATAVGAITGTVSRTGSSTTSLTFTLASGSTVNAASDVNDCVQYNRNGTTTVGDVVDSSGNQQLDNDSAFVLDV